MFLEQVEYNDEVIKEQYWDGKSLWITTRDKYNGMYGMWKHGSKKKLGESRDVLELRKYIK